MDSLKLQMMRRIIIGLVGALAVCGAVAQTPRITFNVPLLYPEGVFYDSAGSRFFVSSVTTGTIGTVDKQGNYKVFYEDRSLKSSFAIKADYKRNKLWICTGDPHHSRYSDSSSYKKLIRLISLDMTSGKKINDIDLSTLYAGKHFANDLALDDKGNMYITDSYSPVIYKVDAEGKASVFAQNELFKGEDVGLNGIAWSPKGFLLTVNNSNGSLLKVDANDGSMITVVKVKNFFPGADGLLWDEQNNLVLIQNKGVNKAYQISSKDNWLTAEIKATTAAEDRFQYPSTATINKGKIYVMNSKLNELDDPTLPPSKEFSLQLVLFKPAQ